MTKEERAAESARLEEVARKIWESFPNVDEFMEACQMMARAGDKLESVAQLIEEHPHG